MPSKGPVPGYREPFLQRRSPYPLRYTERRRERHPRLAIGNQLYTEKQSDPANIADDTVLPNRVETRLQLLTHPRGTFDQPSSSSTSSTSSPTAADSGLPA
jgi:hypothetical protein